MSQKILNKIMTTIYMAPVTQLYTKYGAQLRLSVK